MLAKKYRLNRKEIETLFRKNPRKISADSLGARFIRNEQPYSRFGVNVSAKVAKKATERNRLRRLIFEVIGDKVLANRVDMLISVYKVAPEEMIRKNLEELLSKINQ